MAPPPRFVGKPLHRNKRGVARKSVAPLPRARVCPRPRLAHGPRARRHAQVAALRADSLHPAPAYLAARAMGRGQQFDPRGGERYRAVRRPCRLRLVRLLRSGEGGWGADLVRRGRIGGDVEKVERGLEVGAGLTQHKRERERERERERRERPDLVLRCVCMCARVCAFERLSLSLSVSVCLCLSLSVCLSLAGLACTGGGCGGYCALL